MKKFDHHVVGSRIHQELWVPAEELAEFNRHLIGKIHIEAAYYGENFKEQIDPETNLPTSFITFLECEPYFSDS